VNGANYQKMLTGSRPGFKAAIAEILKEKAIKDRNDEMYQETLAAMKRTFKPEFVGRIKKDVVLFHPLEREHCRVILDSKLASLQRMFSGATASSIPLMLAYTDRFKEYLLDEGVSVEYGVRELEGAIRDDVERLLARSLSSNQLYPGDDVLFDLETIGEKQAVVVRRKPRTVAQKTALAAIRPAPTVVLQDPGKDAKK
jgi:ATP-dependent Clp protease ATP-binding subunit ClpA